MGKIISCIHLSLDGYMADAQGGIGFIAMDAELAGYIGELWKGAAGTVYGRVTYQMMDPYWPNVLKNPGQFPGWQVDYARWVDKAVKVVVTRTLAAISWNNTRIVRENVVEEIGRVKAEVKGDLLLLASATLAGTLLPAGLIDEVVVTLSPVVLGKGRAFFAGLPGRVPLRLLDMRRFGSGAVALRYGVVAG